MAKFYAGSAKMSAAVLTGDKALDRQLGRLRNSVKNKLNRQGLLAALRVVQKSMKREIKTNSATNTAWVKKTIGHRYTKRGKRTNQEEVLVGVNVGSKSLYAPHGVFFLSSSHQERFRKSGGSTGVFPRMQSHGAIMRGWANSEDVAFGVMMKKLREGIEREARKK